MDPTGSNKQQVIFVPMCQYKSRIGSKWDTVLGPLEILGPRQQDGDEVEAIRTVLMKLKGWLVLMKIMEADLRYSPATPTVYDLSLHKAMFILLAQPKLHPPQSLDLKKGSLLGKILPEVRLPSHHLPPPYTIGFNNFSYET